MKHEVLPGYLKILQAARGNQKPNKAFLDALKKKKPRDLDRVTHEFHYAAFENIDCLQCGNCCATTGPLLKPGDIDALAADRNMRPGEFTAAYLKVDEDGDYVFQKLPCPFLDADNYCSVYESRPGACRDYPHTNQRNIAAILPITFLNSMICPAVAVVVEKLKAHYSDVR
jgi:hypothetical protein